MDEYSGSRGESVAPLLSAFDAVATAGHVTRAAENLDVPQSSVSRRIRALERIVGVELMHTVGRGVGLTAAGREFHERTREAVHAVDAAVAAVRASADPESGIVRFGFPLTLGSRAASRLLAEFHTAAPRVSVQVVQAHGRSLSEMIHDGRLDIAVMIPPRPEMNTTVLGHQRLFLHVARSHPLAQRSEVSIDELSSAKFVASPTAFHLRELLDVWCRDAGFVPRVSFEINEIATIRALVRADLGVALLPSDEVEDPQVVALSIAGHPSREIGLATGRYRPTPAVTRFRDHVLTSFAKAVPNTSL